MEDKKVESNLENNKDYEVELDFNNPDYLINMVLNNQEKDSKKTQKAIESGKMTKLGKKSQGLDFNPHYK